MLINEQTKIAALLKFHNDALDAIVALSPAFNKLRNPLLRKLMAGRTSIAMAAKIGGCTPKDFFKALAPLGFKEDVATPTEVNAEAKQPLPDYLTSLKPEQIINFDVREMIASGDDPLRQIQEKVKELKPGEALKIVNTFEPVPLIKLLERQGFQAYVDNLSDDLIETYFYKTNNDVKATFVINTDTATDWDDLLAHYNNRLVEIDVRHLEMPMPMMTILESLENLPDGKALYVHHKRIPVFLLTELKDRNFEFRIKEVQEGEVYLLIFKNA